MHLRFGRDGHVGRHVAIGGLADSVLGNNQQVTIWITSPGRTSPFVGSEGLVLAVAQLADDLVLAQALLLLLLLVALQADVAAAGGASLGIDKVIRVLLNQCRMVLLLRSQCRLHGSVQLGALSVQNLALSICILDASSADLNAALVDGMGLELQAVLLLRGCQNIALVASVLRRRRLPACANALLVVDQDTINAAFATTLILREAAHLILHLALALAVISLRHGRCPMASSLVHGALL